MKYVFLAVFIIATAIHLYASLKQDKKMRNMTKPFILLALLGFYVLAARVPSTFIILALIFSWLGDVLLMPKGVKWFTAGGIAFMISHVFFILGYLKDVPSAATLTTAIGAALFFISDSSLFFVRFNKDSRLKTHFLVMLTYSIGELLIVLGLL